MVYITIIIVYVDGGVVLDLDNGTCILMCTSTSSRLHAWCNVVHVCGLLPPPPPSFPTVLVTTVLEVVVDYKAVIYL